MLDKMLRETVEKYSEKTAIIHDTLRISYKEIYSDIEGLSNGLRSIGLTEGDCVALILPNYPQFITSFFAVARINAVVLLVNPALAEKEIQYYIDDSNAVSIITDAKRAELCRSIIARSDKKISLIVIDETSHTDIDFNDLLKDKTVYEKQSVFEGDVAYQYSSGSTGRPKRVAKTQKNLYCEAYNFHTTTNTTASDNFLCLVPLFHAHGLGNCMLAAAYTGATLVILEDLKKNGTPITVPFVLRRQRVLELVDNEKFTVLPGVPFVFSALADTPDDFQVDVTSLRLCFSAGNFLSEDVFKKFMQRFDIPVRQLYGCTEVGSFSINLEPVDDIHHDSVGLPMKNNEVKIVDDSGSSLPNGTIGEVMIKSEALTNGYYNMPELNKEAFKNGYFLTGDLGKKDEKGRLYITGRKKIFIEVGGNKVDPFEIEDVMITHPNVKEVVVVGIKEPIGGEAIKAVIVPEGECKKHDLILHCKECLASFKIPQFIEFREEIPKSPLGKILRKDLI